jgi:cytochrome c553
MAAYFAALDVPYPPPQTAAAPAALLERGRRLVLDGDPARRLPACVACHGASMTGVQPAVPGLLGLPRDYLTAQLGAWRTGTRKALAPDCMAQVVRAMQDEEIGAVAHYLASLPVPGGGKPASSLPAPLPLDCGGVPR